MRKWGRIVIKTIKWIVLSLAFLGVISVGGCWLIGFLLSPSHDTDEDMLRNFTDNRAVFEEIITRLQRDKDILRVDDTWYRLTDGKARNDNPDRITLYRKLFKKISTERGIYAYHSSSGHPRVLFLSNSQGMATGGSSKGYLYDPYPENNLLLVNSIDDYDPQKDLWRSYWAVHRKIKGASGWYLYCDFDD